MLTGIFLLFSGIMAAIKGIFRRLLTSKSRDFYSSGSRIKLIAPLKGRKRTFFSKGSNAELANNHANISGEMYNESSSLSSLRLHNLCNNYGEYVNNCDAEYAPSYQEYLGMHFHSLDPRCVYVRPSVYILHILNCLIYMGVTMINVKFDYTSVCREPMANNLDPREPCPEIPRTPIHR